ncbi:MAG: hypothetical protein ACT4TC_11800 [Myxococcaceae bacterium]
MPTFFPGLAMAFPISGSTNSSRVSTFGEERAREATAPVLPQIHGRSSEDVVPSELEKPFQTRKAWLAIRDEANAISGKTYFDGEATFQTAKSREAELVGRMQSLSRREGGQVMLPLMRLPDEGRADPLLPWRTNYLTNRVLVATPEGLGVMGDWRFPTAVTGKQSRFEELSDPQQLRAANPEELNAVMSKIIDSGAIPEEALVDLSADASKSQKQVNAKLQDLSRWMGLNELESRTMNGNLTLADAQSLVDQLVTRSPLSDAKERFPLNGAVSAQSVDPQLDRVIQEIRALSAGRQPQIPLESGVGSYLTRSLEKLRLQS